MTDRMWDGKEKIKETLTLRCSSIRVINWCKQTKYMKYGSPHLIGENDAERGMEG